MTNKKMNDSLEEMIKSLVLSCEYIFKEKEFFKNNIHTNKYEFDFFDEVYAACMKYRANQELINKTLNDIKDKLS